MSKFLVTKKVFKDNSNLPYDAEIEYLEGNGGIINTEHIPTLNTSMEFEMMPLSYTGANYIGFTPSMASEDDSADFRFFATEQNHIYFDFSYGRIDESNVNFSLNNWYTIRCYNYGVTINGTTYSNSYVDGYIDSMPIHIFGNTINATDVNFKLKYLKIYENDQLVQDLIPVRKGTIGYIYDKVSGQLFENIGSGSFILGSDTKIIEPEIPEENQPSSKFIIGKQVLEIDDINKKRFSTIKKHFETKIQLNFDSVGGNIVESKEVVLGKSYGELPVPTKSQHIFLGWFTNASGGIQITSDSIASLDINTLYAQWEYVQIASDCTSYSVTTTSSYKNTGIYTASIADSSQPIYIDWGDGTVEKLTSSISQKSYTYKTVGNFIVKISDNITSFAPSYNNSTWYGTTSQNRNTFKGMLTTGSKVISLPTYAFYYCLEMTNIDFMQTCWPTVTSLPDYCFYYCSGLTSIQGVKRFTSLGQHCFNHCKGLTGVQDLSEFKFTTLSNTYTFANCTNVTQWILPSGFTGTSFGNYMFVNNSKLNGVGNSEKTTQQLNVTEIEFLEYTAQSNSYIDTQILPTTVGKWEIDIQIISSSGKSQFLGCYANDNNDALLALATPDGSKSYYPFKYGSNWNDTSMNIDITQRHAIKYEFQPNSQNIYVDNILKVSSTYDAWTNNENNTIRLFCIKNNEYYARTLRIFACKLYNNTSLVRDFIPARVGNIGYMYDKVSGQLFGNSGSGSFIIGPDKANTEEIIVEQEIITSKLPESLTSTGTYAFQNCSNLNNIIIPSKVQSIGTYAFYGCTSLNNVNIEATNLTAINRYAFYNCNKLADLDLPDTVKTIGNYAFYGCTSLNYAGRMANDLPYDAEIEYLESDGNQWIDTEIIPTEIDEAEILVYFKSNDSSGSKVLFGTATPRLWVTTGTCRFNEENKCAINTKRILNEWNSIKINKNICVCNETEIQMSDGTFQFTQNTVWLFGVNSSLAKTNARIKSFIWKRNNVEILNFIPVRVGNTGYMYDKVSGQLFGNSGTGNFILGPDVKTKELPSQLTSIGTNAYQGCSNLKSLNIPENLQTIGDYAFAGCYQISSIVDKRLSAQTVSTNTFGNTTGTGIDAYTGYQTKGNNILSTYFATTGYDENTWDDPLQNPDKCGFIQQYIDHENIVYHTVTFNAGIGSISETSISIIKGKKIGELPTPIITEEQLYFGGWSTTENDINAIITKDYRVTSDVTLYALYSTTPFANYEVILNDQWQASTIANPDSSQYDGVYESFSNYNIGSKAAVMYIKIKGYTTFTIYIRSYAESSYDYTVAFNLDTYMPSNPLTSNPSSSTSGVKAHTSGKQNSGTAIGSYTKVEYTGIDGGEHYICVAYRKDGSVNNGNDRGYVLIEKQDIGAFEPAQYITVNFEVGEGTLVSGETTAIDVQGSTLSRFPEISAPISKPYFVGWNTMADGSGEYYDATTILPNQESLILYAYYVAEDPIDPNKDIYLCFTAEQANSTIQLRTAGTAPTVYLETSRTCNNILNDWSDFTVGETTITLSNVGDKIYFRAKQDNERFATSTSNYNIFVMTGKIAASGNLNTLLKADGSVLDLTGRNYCYNRMFYNCRSLTQAPKLPATTLIEGCYTFMFRDCASLTQAPELPATKLAYACYWGMFYSCSSLTQAPELPATTLADSCYYSMFNGCTSLIQAPTLPATSLAGKCYNYMFQSCTSLTQAPELPATKLANNCYQNMFYGCTSLTQAPELPATTLANNCYQNMFYNCKSLTSVPELPAETLAENCYNTMFRNCTKINNINVNFSAWDPSNATSSWVSNVSSSGTFICPADLPETYGTSYIPVNWITKSPYWGLCFTAEEPNSTISMTKGELAPEISLYTSIDGRNWTQFIPNETTITLANVGDNVYFKSSNSGNNRFCSTNGITNEYANIFSMTGKIAASGNIMSLLNGDNPTTNLQYDYTFVRLFQDCTSLTQAPKLPATELTNYCYSGMFFNCTSLTQAPELPATNLADGCYSNMFYGCSSLTQTTSILPATSLVNYCYNSMFEGCTSLTQAPELPATDLITGCYTNMFVNCASLSSITTNILEWSQADATDNWLYNVSPIGTFTCYENLPQERGPNRIPTNWIIDNSITKDPNLQSYLCFTAEEPNSTIAIEKVGAAPDVSLKTTVNGIIWQPFTVGETTITLANTGDKVYFKANENDNMQFATSTSIYNKFVMTGKVAASGNIQSLLYKDEIINELPATYCYTGLFRDCSALTQAPELPVEQLSTYCYGYMFNGCISLSTSPVLSSTNIANQCYMQMFANCSSLTSAPELPATQLKTTCYSNMFNGCTSLSIPPTLPATSLSTGCYTNMFANCTSLTSAPQLPTENIAIRCYSGMFTNCISLTSIPELPATSLKSGCYMNMFNGCTSISSSTLLPATSLVATCYSNMFNGCSSLTSINVNLSAWNIATGTTNWLSGVSDIGVFNCPESLPETRGISNIPTNWEIIRK